MAGLDFDDELTSALARLQKTPVSCSPYLHNRHFSSASPTYSVVFREREQDIRIVAVAHARRLK